MEPDYCIPPIRVMIADDHAFIRRGFKSMLKDYPDLVLVAEAADGEQAVLLAQAARPDVVVMDIRMPIKDGITAIQEISAANPGARILVFTSFPDYDVVFDAIRSGALGYLLKDSSPEVLAEAIRTVYRGEAVISPGIAARLMVEIRMPLEPPPKDQLTRREMDVLRCLARGLSNQEIALELKVSVRTVTTHVRNILEKLHVANRTQAALYAIDQIKEN